MLSELEINNFAIIEQQAVTFGPGLNVISGETGAGKSILLQALELILGGRARNDLIRAGSSSCEVRAVFDLSRLSRAARGELPEIVEGEELLVTRIFSGDGRSKVFINGHLGTLAVLEGITQRLVNVCGQGHFVRLLEPRYHLELVDGFAEDAALLNSYKAAFDAWSNAERRLREIENSLADGARRRAQLSEVLEELEKVKLWPGCRLELEAKVKKLSSSEELRAISLSLSEAVGGEDGILTKLGSLGSTFGDLKKVDGDTAELCGLFASAKTELDELGRLLEAYHDTVNVDEEELARLREELAEVARLERRFRTNDAGLIELLERSRQELSLLQDDNIIETLRVEVQDLFTKVSELGERLSAERVRAGKQLAKAVELELAELAMTGAKLSLKQEGVEFGPNGKDKVEILIASNKGEPLRPLRQVASGGELSRVMLVLKKVLRDRTGVNVLVFDEVDSGVSGGVARAVGDKLKTLANYSQVLCITHLPQIASLADKHLLVEKVVGKRAVSEVREIQGEDRVEEIARMLAGYKVTESTRQSARELLACKK